MRHITCLSEWMKRCIVKPINYDKVWEVTQEKDENRAVFLSQVTEASQKYTIIDTESAEARRKGTIPFNGIRTFKTLKTELSRAPALGLPHLDKPFTLYVQKRSGETLGVLTQKLGSYQRPVAYFSKQLDSVALGWPSFLWAVAATALVVNEASKFTPGQHLDILTSHQV